MLELQSDDREDIHMIVKLNVAKNVNAAFDNFLNEEVILDRECPVCKGGDSDLLFGYDDPAYYLSQPFSQY